jgi:hypothetical protein
MFAINDEIQPEVRLPQLKSLILRAVHYESITGYLDTFIVPALRSLQVPEQCLGANPIDVLASFISKSGCTLQELHITEEISVIKDLSEYRDLRHLRLGCRKALLGTLNVTVKPT